MKLLVTGGCGFIGSHFIKIVFKERPKWEILNIDKMTYAGSEECLREMSGKRNYRFRQNDIRDFDKIVIPEQIDAVVNFASESHVDRSIGGTIDFIRTNIEGTAALLEWARLSKVKRFVHVSTDEVYGPVIESGSKGFREKAPLRPENPYAISKAAADFLAQHYYKHRGMDISITRSSNNYGPYQHPEKLMPAIISSILEDREFYIHGDGEQLREWIHVEDNVRAILLVLEKGQPGGIYNIGTRFEKSVLEVAQFIMKEMGADSSYLKFIPDRISQDFRYLMVNERIKKLGWKPRVKFEEGLRETIEWYSENEEWTESMKRKARWTMPLKSL